MGICHGLLGLGMTDTKMGIGKPVYHWEDSPQLDISEFK
jgi:hypothetical protein